MSPMRVPAARLLASLLPAATGSDRLRTAAYWPISCGLSAAQARAGSASAAKMASISRANLLTLCPSGPSGRDDMNGSPEFSALFRPFIVSTTLNDPQQTMFAYAATVGIVLAIPFTIDLLRAGREQHPAILRRWLVAEKPVVEHRRSA